MIISNFIFFATIFIVLAIVGWLIFSINKATSKKTEKNVSPRLEDVTKTYPELRDLASEAQHKGATHYDYIGAAMFFYRNHEGKVERCFVEYSPASRRYEWIWTSWHPDIDVIPDGALPIPEKI